MPRPAPALEARRAQLFLEDCRKALRSQVQHCRSLETHRDFHLSRMLPDTYRASVAGSRALVGPLYRRLRVATQQAAQARRALVTA